MSAAALPSPPMLRRFAWTRPGELAAVLLFAAVLRCAMLLVPITHHPDEIYQYWEPAHRLLTGDGIVAWEWREGIRGWLLPTLLAVPMALGRWIGFSAELLLPRLTVIALSLTIVHTAWRLGAARSREHALVASIAAACWYSLLCFAPRTLSEPVATALLFPAALWLADPASSPRRLGAAGALLALAIVARPHYAPAAAVLALVALGRRLPRAATALVLGAMLALAAGGLADMAQGQQPLAWIANNVLVNVIQDRASGFGVEPPSFYLSRWLHAWSWWTPVVLAGLMLGWRASPALAAAAVVNLIVHMLIGHKEPRFIFFSEAAVIVLAAIGTVEIGRRLRLGWPTVAAFWIAASVLLAFKGDERFLWRAGRPGHLATQALRSDPQACGLALVDTSYTDVPGRSHLPPGLPVAQFARSDPAMGGRAPAVAFGPYAPAFNRVLTKAETRLPGYRDVLCANDHWDRLCLRARPGGCTARPDADRWSMQVAMRRSGH